MAYRFVLFVLVPVDHGKGLPSPQSELGLWEGVRSESPPAATATLAWGCRITVTIITIYMLMSCLPRQSDKYLKILNIIESILFLIYKVNYLY